MMFSIVCKGIRSAILQMPIVCLQKHIDIIEQPLIFWNRKLYSRSDKMRTDAITLPVQVLAVLTAFDLCDPMRFKFLAFFGGRVSTLAVICSRSSFETAPISIVGGLAV
jgi:hypothetical protein